MIRKKHKKDTKANIHWERWERAKRCEKYKIFNGFKHSDWNIEGKLKRYKIIKKMLNKYLREMKNENY